VRINGMTDVGVDGLCLAWTSPPSHAASLVCNHGKNAIKRSCVSRHSRLQKRAADLSFLLHTASGDIGLVVLPFAVLSRHCFIALIRCRASIKDTDRASRAPAARGYKRR
jgi:hypothetical protein